MTDIGKLKKRGVVVGVGYRGPNPAGKTVNPFCAQFCEVEVDTRTGEVKILRFLSANDSGRVMNRLTYDNQVFGGITMGIGLATTEMRIFDGLQTGKLVNRNWHDYKLPTALDVPADMTSVPIEVPDPEANITGAKGLGEPVTIPTAAAVANAVYHATGIRITTSPINPTSAQPGACPPEKGDLNMLPQFAYVRPQTPAQAVSHLSDEGARAHAGGTDLLGCLRDEIFQVTKIVSLAGLAELHGIQTDRRRRTAHRRPDDHHGSGRASADPAALPCVSPRRVRGGQPAAEKPGNHRRQSLPEAALLVLSRRIQLPAQGRSDLLCGRGRKPVSLYFRQ